MSRSRMAVLAALAGTGLAAWVAGHYLDYLLLAPDAAHRGHLLSLTGHGYLSSLTHLAIAGGLIGLFAAAGLGWSRGAAGRGPSRWGGVAARLCALQVIAFVGVELTERLLSGAPFRGAGLVLALGVALQILTAALGTLLLRLVFVAAETIARQRRWVRAAAEPRLRCSFDRDLTSARALSALGARAPPALLVC